MERRRQPCWQNFASIRRVDCPIFKDSSAWVLLSTFPLLQCSFCIAQTGWSMKERWQHSHWRKFTLHQHGAWPAPHPGYLHVTPLSTYPLLQAYAEKLECMQRQHWNHGDWFCVMQTFNAHSTSMCSVNFRCFAQHQAP